MTQFILERVADPEIEPVSLTEMKRHLREFDSVTVRDDDISALITAAREWVEDYTGRALIDQSWRLTIDNGRRGYLTGDRVSGYQIVPGYYAGHLPRWSRVGELLLRKAPVIDVTSFVTVDADGVETELDTETYELREARSKWPRLVAVNGATWTGAETLRVTFRAGFADLLGSPQQDATAVPARFKQAIKLWVQAHYDTDPAMLPMLMTAAENLVKSEKSDLCLA